LNTRRGGIKYGILFMFSLFYEYRNLECVRIHVICRVNQAEYVIRILVAAPQECVNTYSTCRVVSVSDLRSLPQMRRRWYANSPQRSSSFTTTLGSHSPICIHIRQAPVSSKQMGRALPITHNNSSRSLLSVCVVCVVSVCLCVCLCLCLCLYVSLCWVCVDLMSP